METLETDTVEIPLDFSKLPPKATEEQRAQIIAQIVAAGEKTERAFDNLRNLIAELRERGIDIQPTPL